MHHNIMMGCGGLKGRSEQRAIIISNPSILGFDMSFVFVLSSEFHPVMPPTWE